MADEATALSPEPEETPEQTPAELKAELREAKAAQQAAEALAEERRATVEFWQEREKKGKVVPKTPPAQTPDPEPLDELDLLTLLTEEKDPARIKATFAKAVKSQIAAELKRGNYVSREEAEGYVAGMIESATTMNRLVADFPDLAKPKSEFFAETQKQLAALENDPTMKGTPLAAMERMAAQQAKLALIEAGKLGNEADDDRYERIANQRGGSRGRSKPADDGSLTAAEKQAAARYGLTEAQYLEGKKHTNYGPALTVERMMRDANG